MGLNQSPQYLDRLILATTDGIQVVEGAVFPAVGTGPTILARAYSTGYILYFPLVLNPMATPAAPAEGEVYYDSTAHKLKVYTGAAWETISSSV